jgi:hypothetical protein
MLSLDRPTLSKGMQTRVLGVFQRGGFRSWEHLGSTPPDRVRRIKGCGNKVFKEIVGLVLERCKAPDPGWLRRWNLGAVIIKPEEQKAVFRAIDNFVDNYRLDNETHGILNDVRARFVEALREP